VQLRQDNAEGSMFNIVGFQTHLKWPEQKRVFSMIPALENAEFVRYGVMHRNTYINSPGILDCSYNLKSTPRIFFAGQITGVEGYVESTSSGMVAGINAALDILGKPRVCFPTTTATGGLSNYISTPNRDFQPMNVNFSLIAELPHRIRNKKDRNIELSQRALTEIENFLDTIY
jgi:methylenetetrahydrofolate--tRNA-(uracil-5-)-methyltransferase